MNTTNTQDPIKLALAAMVSAQSELAVYRIDHPERNEETHGLMVLLANAILALQTAAAQPQGDVVVSWNEARTRIVGVTRQDEEGRILKVIAEAPTQPQGDAREAAEAWRKTPCDDDWHAESLAFKLDTAFQAGAAWQAATAPASEPSVPLEKFRALCRGLEIPEGAEVLEPHQLEVIGGAIAKQAKQAAAPARAVEPLTPLRGEEIYRIARRVAPTYAGMTYVPEWVIALARALEEAHGIGIPATTPTKTQGGAA